MATLDFSPETRYDWSKQIGFNYQVNKFINTDLLSLTGPLQVSSSTLFGSSQAYDFNGQDVDNFGDITQDKAAPIHQADPDGTNIGLNTFINAPSGSDAVTANPVYKIQFSSNGGSFSTRNLMMEIVNHSTQLFTLEKSGSGTFSGGFGVEGLTVGGVSGDEGTFCFGTFEVDRSAVTGNTFIDAKNNASGTAVQTSLLTQSFAGLNRGLVGTWTSHDLLIAINGTVDAYWTYDTSGHYSPGADGTQDVGIAGKSFRNGRFSGSNSQGITSTAKTANYTLTSNDYTVLCDTSGGAFTITLPTAVTDAGIIYVIKDNGSAGSNTITIASTSSQTIDGSVPSTYNITSNYGSLKVQSDGSNWWIIP
jgi:hypothetical protein